MPSKEKLLERQLELLRVAEVREVPAPVPLKLMPAIARDARDMMNSQALRNMRDSDSLDIPGFFDKPPIDWIDMEEDAPQRGFVSEVPRRLKIHANRHSTVFEKHISVCLRSIRASPSYFCT
jgi:hypothetical protein